MQNTGSAWVAPGASGAQQAHLAMRQHRLCRQDSYCRNCSEGQVWAPSFTPPPPPPLPYILVTAVNLFPDAQ